MQTEPSPRLRAPRRTAPLGNSKVTRRLASLCERAAATSEPVFIVGESGTGKNTIAQFIHQLSARPGPLVTVNCGAISETLTHSEFFGHEQGSFTGALETTAGYFESADGGTLFLDELADMPPALQVQLLRTLETGTFRRLGGTATRRADVRLISAMNRDPYAAVDEGSLRLDLLHRLLTIPIETPALRKRPGDIALLAQHFVDELNASGKTAKRLPPDAGATLGSHDWPGNIRELRNFIQRIHILAGDNPVLDVGMLRDVAPRKATHAQPLVDGNVLSVKIGTPLADTQHALIHATLRQHRGNKRTTARALGLSLKTLYNRLHAARPSGDREAV
ncbi:MAG: sigma 54-interacting transcriptional regulator [Candidimonas sp.]